MKERPILFNGEMVRAILEGRKTQTRRIIVPQREWGGQPMALWKCESCPDSWIWNAPDYPDSKDDEIRCPYGVAGDRLWVRETWQELFDPKEKRSNAFEDTIPPTGHHILYRASDAKPKAAHWNWRPSIHMPRWASRITLEILKVRVERLQEISEEDAKSEGIQLHQAIRGIYKAQGRPYQQAYARLWDSLYGKGAWEKNPWVWRLDFKKL